MLFIGIAISDRACRDIVPIKSRYSWLITSESRHLFRCRRKISGTYEREFYRGGINFPRRDNGSAASLKDRPEVTVEYFVPDDRKAGGAYVSVTGRVRHISVPDKILVMEDGAEIPLDDIVSMTGEIFCRI